MGQFYPLMLISEQALYNWRRQDQIDRGERTGLTSSDRDAHSKPSSRRRNAQNELLPEVYPKRRYEAVALMVSEGHVVHVSCGVEDVSDSGYYEWQPGRHRNARSDTPGSPR